jgi:hypothetical protein
MAQRWILISLLLALAATARAESTPYKTHKLPLGCGQADKVWDTIRAIMAPDTPTFRRELPAKQGESFRMLMGYDDGSYFLTLEFFSDVGPEEDRSCIVATGPEDTADEAAGHGEYPLPAGAIGG